MTDAALFTILQTIQADIQALNLTGLTPANILINKAISTKVQDLPVEQYPCVLIAPWGAETVKEASNIRDDVTYPVIVCIFADEMKPGMMPREKQEQNFNQYLTWRERIRKSFNNQSLNAGAAYIVRVQPLAIVDRTAFDKDKFVSGMILNVTNRETRG